MGNSIDCYAPADGILTAQWYSSAGYGSNRLRYDTYTGGTPSMYDGKFGGTSAACPVATGLIACLLSNNRDWSWREVRGYIKKGLQRQKPEHFYYGRESVTANDSNWSVVIYELPEGGKVDAVDFFRGNGLTVSGPLTIKA
jgi:subtilisin family serine protease